MLEEFQDKIRSDDKEITILVVIDLVTLCSYLLYEPCKIRFDINPT